MTTIRRGTNGHDTLIGNAGDDWFQAGEGADVMYGNGGADRFDAGAGNDWMSAGAGADSAFGGEGNDTVDGGAGADLVEGGEGSDVIYAGAGADTVYGDDAAGNTAKAGVSYDDLIEAGDGNDLVFGGLGSDEIQGEGGNDTIQGGKDNGKLVWTGGDAPQDPPPSDPEDPVCKIEKALSFKIATSHEGKTGIPGVAVTVTEQGDGTLLFKVQLEPNAGKVADIRGLFLNIEDASLANSLVATSTQKLGSAALITQQGFKADGLTALQGDVTMSGAKQVFDFAVAFGTQGIGKDDVQQATFVLDSTKVDLTLDMLDNMVFGARLTSVGTPGVPNGRGESLKLLGNSGSVVETKICDTAETPAPTPSPAPATPKTLSEIVIGDNLYGNGGRDTFIFEKGDGVDLIWDFESGQDVVIVKGYSIADVDAFTFVNQVTNQGRDGVNPLDAGSHQKLAVILDAGGDAIIFNDLGNREASGAAIRFDDGSLTIKQLLARATPSTAPVSQAPAEMDLLDAVITVTNAWWGGFQAEIKVTAKTDLTDWDVLLGTKWNVQNVWNAVRETTTTTQDGVLIDLNDADWNGTLAAGQSTTIGFTALTGMDAILGSQQILDGIWFG